LNLDLDARQDTAHGVLLGHAELQFDNSNGFDNVGNLPNLNRAYLQWAGITAGKANSFLSFFDGGTAWANIFSPNQRGLNQPDLLAYAARLASGFSATFALQSSGPKGNGDGTNLAIPTNASFFGMTSPDIGGSELGSAQFSSVAHQVRVADATIAAHTQNTWGWGILGGAMINLPMLSPGDEIQVQGVWTKNALWYSGIPDGLWASTARPTAMDCPCSSPARGQTEMELGRRQPLGRSKAS
jgi:hypothetical protein